MKKYIVNENKKGAFHTLQDALATAKLDAPTLQDDEAIYIIVEGVQHLRETLRIDSQQMPGKGHPVFIEGAGEGSGISGGIRLTDFSLWKDNIWRIKVPEVEYTRHLYIDGKSAKRPSTPYIKSYAWDVLQSEEYYFSNLPDEPQKKMKISNSPGREFEVDDYSGIATTHTEIATWKNVRDLEMVFEVGWVHRVVPIEYTCMLPDGNLYIKPLEPAFRSAKSLSGVQIGGCPNYIENVFELLGQPLQWYFDRVERMLYLGFEENDSPENHEIVIPLVEQLIEVKGELDNKICHLSFRNLRFSDTTWIFPQKYGVPEVQANQMNFVTIPEELIRDKPYDADYQKVIAALRVLASKNITFENCTFTTLGTGALQFEYGTQDCRIVGNHFCEIGASAVSIGEFFPERGHHPSDRREIVRCIQVLSNRIHNIGRECRGAAAIIAGYVQDVTIAHNEIYDVPYTGISVCWGWGYSDVSVGPMRPTPWKEPTVCMRNHIVYNHIYRCMRELNDGGAIYTLGYMPGSLICGNYIHDSAGFKGDGFAKVHLFGYEVERFYDPTVEPFRKLHGFPGGIYLDEGSAGIEVSENVFHDVAIPLNYHNQIDNGHKMVCFRDNIINQRPGDPNFPLEITQCAGPEPTYRRFYD